MISQIFSVMIVVWVYGWIILILVYPRSPRIQSVFFWNRTVRRILGLGFVGIMLAKHPPLRKRLLEPFRNSLLSGAKLEDFDLQNYFEGVEVRPVRVKGRTVKARAQNITEAIPEVRRQIVISGESGSGKTMFLRYLLRRSNKPGSGKTTFLLYLTFPLYWLWWSKRTAVYLSAEACSNGVMDAIKAKLDIPARDPVFLEKLVCRGAIDICIDGLDQANEVTQYKITEFADEKFRGNMIITARSLDLELPYRANVYVMEPLTVDKIGHFFATRKRSLPEDAILSEEEYDQTCSRYLSEALNEELPEEVLIESRKILSNPGNLVEIAQALARGQMDDLLERVYQASGIKEEPTLNSWIRVQYDFLKKEEKERTAPQSSEYEQK